MGCLQSHDPPVWVAPKSTEDSSCDEISSTDETFAAKQETLRELCDSALDHANVISDCMVKMLTVEVSTIFMLHLFLTATTVAELLKDLYTSACEVMNTEQLHRHLLRTVCYERHSRDPIDVMLKLEAAIRRLVEHLFLMPTFTCEVCKFVTGEDRVPMEWMVALHEPRLSPRAVALAVQERLPMPFVLSAMLLDARTRRMSG